MWIIVCFFLDLEDHRSKPPSTSRAANLAADVLSLVSISPLYLWQSDPDLVAHFKLNRTGIFRSEPFRIL
jgi:hypothetical protein